MNETLWKIEDDLRTCERAGEFGPAFIDLARSVYRTNDRRADLKRQVNVLLGSSLCDEKQYQAYTPDESRLRRSPAATAVIA